MKKNVSLLLTLLIFVTGYTQSKQFCINDTGLGLSLKSAEVVDNFDVSVKKARPFALNPELRNHSNITIGDTLRLSLFTDKEYLSVIQSRTTDVNGTTVLVAKLTGFQFAWCFISLTEQSALVTVDIPERKEKYTTRFQPQKNTQYLVQLDENKLDILKDGQMTTESMNSFQQNIRPNNIDKSTQIRKENINLQNSGELKAALLTPSVDDSAQIDILVVYTPAAREWADTHEGGINNTISQAMAKCNLVSCNSKLGIKFNLVHSTVVDYSETGNSTIDLNNLTEGSISNVYSIRDAVAADLVVFFTQMYDVGGRAWLLDNRDGNNEYGYSAIRIQQASELTTIHEIGHNLGASHHKEQNFEPGPTSWSNWPENTWSAGWRWKGDDNNYYCDVMTYPDGYYFSDGITHTQIPYFSDPSVNFQGQSAGHAAEANNVRTIREMKHAVANYCESKLLKTPTVYTVNVHDIAKEGAVSGGFVTNEGESSVKARGIVWSTKRMPTLNDHFTVDSSDEGAFISLLNGLVIDTTYYVRAYATNEAGTAYGNQVSFIYTAGEKRDFITRWQLTEGHDELHLILDRIGEVNYTWETVPASQSGSGTFALGEKMVKITNLPAGKVIRVRIATNNLTGFYTSYLICPYPAVVNPDRENLIDLEQWGTIHWKKMENAFFECSKLDISATDMPDLSNVTSMCRMFAGCKSLSRIDRINKWSVSTIKNLSSMFNQAEKFNQDIGDWDVSSVKNMRSMFGQANSFNQDISKWDVSQVTDIGNMFCGAENFNQDIGRWAVSNVLNMNNMFAGATNFNQNIGNWDVSHVEDFSLMFGNATSFNQNVGRWDVSNSKNLGSMFYRATNFNQDIGPWDVSNVVHMYHMFSGALAFNRDISEWDVSSVKEMQGMFCDASNFNQDIGNWNVSNVIDMNSMFTRAQSFNQNIGGWDVSSVTDMENMFNNATNFNQNISGWDVSRVSNMHRMFSTAFSFNQDLGKWNLSGSPNMKEMLDLSNVDCFNYSATLSGWSANANTPDNLCIGAQGLGFGNNAKDARINLTTTKKWTITGDAATGATCDLKTNVIRNSIYNSNLKVYPNPVTNELTIEIEGNNEEFDFQIINAIGQTVYKGNIKNQTTIQTGSFAPGMYLVRFENNSTLEFKKVIKK